MQTFVSDYLSTICHTNNTNTTSQYAYYTSTYHVRIFFYPQILTHFKQNVDNFFHVFERRFSQISPSIIGLIHSFPLFYPQLWISTDVPLTLNHK